MISHEDIKKLSKEDYVRFAIKAANLVSHLNDDPKVLDAIEAAEDWLADPSEENKEAARVAAWATYTAVITDDAAWNATNAAADAAWSTWVADSAANAANSAIKADPNTKPVLVKYLEELLARRSGND